MTAAVRQVELVPVDESRPAQQGSDLVLMFERLAKDKDVDVAKLERLIAMQERILDHNAKAAFNAAFSSMQAEIPEINERGQILNKEGKVQSKYATNEDIQQVLRPILQRFGFSLSFRTEWPDKKTVKVVGILTHLEGHARESEFLSDADTSGNKNSVQALGSAISYGRRYTTLDLLNITSRGMDDDGIGVSRLGKPEPPSGYEDWQINMEAAADEGWPKLSSAFGKSPAEYRSRATGIDKQWWERLKAKAAEITRGQK